MVHKTFALSNICTCIKNVIEIANKLHNAGVKVGGKRDMTLKSKSEKIVKLNNVLPAVDVSSNLMSF